MAGGATAVAAAGEGAAEGAAVGSEDATPPLLGGCQFTAIFGVCQVGLTIFTYH